MKNSKKTIEQFMKPLAVGFSLCMAVITGTGAKALAQGTVTPNPKSPPPVGAKTPAQETHVFYDAEGTPYNVSLAEGAMPKPSMPRTRYDKPPELAFTKQGQPYCKNWSKMVEIEHCDNRGCFTIMGCVPR